METHEFEQHRQRLFAIAYRMLGSASEADDIVQETWLRWSATDHLAVENPEAFLSRIAARLCLDHLKSARVQREAYVGPWLPEPILTSDSSDDPHSRTETTELVSIALLRLLEELSPLERAALLLHDVFHYEHSEVAAMLEVSPAATRQAVSRARKRLPDQRKRFEPSPEAQQALIGRFIEATGKGDMSALQSLLAQDVIARSDGGGKVTAARRPIIGRDAVAKFFLGIASKAPEDWHLDVRQINGKEGMLIYIGGRLFAVFSFEFDDGRISEVSAILNPDKLARIRAQLTAQGHF